MGAYVEAYGEKASSVVATERYTQHVSGAGHGGPPDRVTVADPWWLKSLVIGGRDVLDAALDLRQSATDAVATFADDASELSGTIKDAQGNPVIDHFIVAFSTDRSTWFFNSRRVVGVRPDAQGRYSIRNLPPGQYRVIASAEVDTGEWFDPTVLERLLPSAAALTVTGVEKQTRDFVIR